MTTPFVDIVLEGNQFSPKALKEASGLRIKSLVEYGKVAPKGRYKGQKSPYGLATLKIESTTPEDLNIILNSAIKYLLLECDLLKKYGVDEVSVDTDCMEEMDITFPDEIFKNLAELNKALKEDDSERVNHSMPESNAFSKATDVQILQLYSFLFLKDNRNKLLVLNNENKVRHLFSKVLESNISDIEINQQELFSTVMLYLLSYIDEEFNKVPSFEKVLKENHPNLF